MRVAVIAPGAMGAAIARRLHERGAEVAVTLEGRGPDSAARAAGLRQLPSEAELAAWADIVLSILPPGQALNLARRLAPVLGQRGEAVLYADCNAVSPTTAKAIAAAIPGPRFVDIGIIGGPPGPAGPGPRLYASGDAAAALVPLAQFGIDLRPIEGGTGAASGLKMSYAGITKGLTALGSAMALGAARAGAAAALKAELEASQPGLVQYFARSVPDMFDKAYRWVAEMEEIADFLGDAPAAPIYAAMARHYAELARQRADPSPGDAIESLAEFARKQ
jgi:3-hydroxyisobutyrate dehydrogenase-like beta-hydroxyacid dehydrogenase